MSKEIGIPRSHSNWLNFVCIILISFLYLDYDNRYRTNGDGGQALKLLLTFVKNILDNPNEPK